MNLHSDFIKFNDTIKLSSYKSDNLKISRDALRKDIRNWFSEKNKNQPKFCWQGSFAMKTTVNPISDDYDLDDGVYLQGYSNDENEWPTTTSVHNWVKTATDERTSVDSTDKNTCVRVNYVDGYHIDLPIYIMKDEEAYLAHKSNGWIISDPKAFTDWFIDKVNENNEQLRRLVRYLKAWKDYKDVPLKSIEITILVAENFDGYDSRDDKALLGTIEKIFNALEENFSCVKPVAPGEDLFDGISDTKKNKIISSLTTLKNDLSSAISEENDETATEILQNLFGIRFPKIENSSKSYVVTSSPGVLKHDGRSG